MVADEVNGYDSPDYVYSKIATYLAMLMSGLPVFIVIPSHYSNSMQMDIFNQYAKLLPPGLLPILTQNEFNEFLRDLNANVGRNWHMDSRYRSYSEFIKKWKPSTNSFSFMAYLSQNLGLLDSRLSGAKYQTQRSAIKLASLGEMAPYFADQMMNSGEIMKLYGKMEISRLRKIQNRLNPVNYQILQAYGLTLTEINFLFDHPIQYIPLRIRENI
jgi:hypothetical protein